MHVINLAGVDSVQNPRTGKLHQAGPAGVFTDLPLDFAHELVTRHASHWREASAHEAAQHQAQVEQLRNPHVLPGVVAELRDRLVAAEARIEALETAAAKPARQRQSSGKSATARKSTAPKPDTPPE